MNIPQCVLSISSTCENLPTLVDQYNQKWCHAAADGRGQEDSTTIAGNCAHVKLIILTGGDRPLPTIMRKTNDALHVASGGTK